MVLFGNCSQPRYFSSRLVLAILNSANAVKEGLSHQWFKEKSRNMMMPATRVWLSWFTVISSRRALFHFHASRDLVSMECCIFNSPDVFYVKFTGTAISVNTSHCSVEWYQACTAVSSFQEHYNKAKWHGAEWCLALFQETLSTF